MVVQVIDNAAAPFVQGWRDGALRMNHGEGIAGHGSDRLMDAAVVNITGVAQPRIIKFW